MFQILIRNIASYGIDNIFCQCYIQILPNQLFLISSSITVMTVSFTVQSTWFIMAMNFFHITFLYYVQLISTIIL